MQRVAAVLNYIGHLCFQLERMPIVFLKLIIIIIILSRLQAQPSLEPNRGNELTMLRSRREPRSSVAGFTNWATQPPLILSILFLKCRYVNNHNQRCYFFVHTEKEGWMHKVSVPGRKTVNSFSLMLKRRTPVFSLWDQQRKRRWGLRSPSQTLEWLSSWEASCPDSQPKQICAFSWLSVYDKMWCPLPAQMKLGPRAHHDLTRGKTAQVRCSQAGLLQPFSLL